MERGSKRDPTTSVERQSKRTGTEAEQFKPVKRSATAGKGEAAFGAYTKKDRTTSMNSTVTEGQADANFHTALIEQDQHPDTSAGIKLTRGSGANPAV